jgi:TfoX/Sxy family transcriptional regulator of competence genes
MFGGLAFTVNTHMACGIVGTDLMVRVGKERYESALAAGARQMDFTGRPMHGMVIVDGDRLRDPAALERWVTIAADFALAEPVKPAKRRKTR